MANDSTECIARNLDRMEGAVGIGMRIGKRSIVDRHTDEPLQVISPHSPPGYEDALLHEWAVRLEHIRKRVRGEAP
jgi:hypothetical protein